jgi:hypothetical protein
MICLLRKLRAILRYLSISSCPTGRGITASQAWLTAPATVAFTWLDKSYANEECQTCCRIADAAIAVPGNLGGMEAKSCVARAAKRIGGAITCINPGSIDSAGKTGHCRRACLCRRTRPFGIKFNPAIVSIIGGDLRATQFYSKC